MTDDQKKNIRKEDRLEKAKGRLQQSFPEMQQLIKTANAVDVARKIIDPAQALFKQFADDIQLKDLLAKAEELFATNLGLPKVAPKAAPATQAFRDAPASNESSGRVAVKKTPSKGSRLKKAVPKKTLSKKKKTRAPKRTRV
jgi:hypothetical protein